MSKSSTSTGPSNGNRSGDGLSKQQPVAPGSTNTTTTQGSPANIDDANPVITKKMGVNLSEQQQMVTRLGADGNVRPMTSRADAHLNEQDWDLNKMLF